jgi:sterol desaturase/sphingolipid hydroxylase (fatty acid hydroxylase superfamily)/predicted amino acid dehydrogenase
MVVDSKVFLFPVLWGVAKVFAPNTELTKHVLLATILRYAINLTFTSLAHIESVSYHRRIINKNPPAKQLARELDWDTPLVGSVIAFMLVERITPWLDNPTEFSTTSLALCFAGHFFIVEPMYWLYHLVLHWPKVYKNSHSHHHSSIITESVSGTSHPLHETVGYLVTFSFPILLPAFCGQFSYELVYIYFTFFDIMNCIGHCNFECVPTWLQWGPLKYIFYCSSYHSEHHTKFKKNYCLFCPLWDYLGNTVSKDSYALQRKSLSRSGLQKVDVVFLGHGFGWTSVLHLPMVSPYMSTQQQAMRWWMYPLFPLCALVIFLTRAFMRTCVTIQRYSFKQLACATWSVPVLAYNYMSRRERPYINTLLLKAIRDADDQGATHVGLGALNKAVFLNSGGRDLLPHLHEGCRVKIVHGNTLTAAVAYLRIRQRVRPEQEIVFTGATSMVGTPVVLRLLQDGYKIRILTRSAARFADLRRGAGANGHSLRQIQRYEEGADCRAWVLGTAATQPLGHLVTPGTTFLEFAVPCTEPTYLQPHKVVGIAGIRVDSQVCDLTFCHDRSSDTMPACLAATIIHGLEGFQEHEVGEVDIRKMDEWLRLAEKHGFSLNPPAEADAQKLDLMASPSLKPATPTSTRSQRDFDMEPAIDGETAKRSPGENPQAADVEPPAKRLCVRQKDGTAASPPIAYACPLKALAA